MKEEEENLMTLLDFAIAIGTSQTYVSNLTAEPKIIVTLIDGRKYIDINKYPINKFKKKPKKRNA